MKFHELKKNHKKQIVIGALAVCVVGGTSSTTPAWTGAGLCPVINLKADTLFAPGENGTLNNPYVVQ